MTVENGPDVAMRIFSRMTKRTGDVTFLDSYSRSYTV